MKPTGHALEQSEKGDVPCGFARVFEEELAEQGIHLDVPAEGVESERLKTIYGRIHKDEEPLTALCLSGGGIRSATFNLGLLQGLAAKGLISRFNYLSTVSGGGYIGSWLSAWIKNSGDVSAVEEKLGKPFPNGAELQEVRFLRDYSNYLSPRVGILTADTWTLLSIYLRNLLINWLMFLPLFFALLVLPRLYISSLPPTPQNNLMLWGGFLFGAIGSFCSGSDLPTFGFQWVRFRKCCRRSFLPSLLLAAILLSMYWSADCPSHETGSATLWKFVTFGAAMYWSGWFLPSLLHVIKNGRPALFFLSNIVSITSGFVGGFLAYILGMIIMPAVASATPFAKPAYATWAVPAVLTVFLLAGVIFILGMNKLTGDEDREWWGRAGAYLMMVCIVWSAAFAAVIYGPLLLFHDLHDTRNALDGLAKACGLGGIAGLVTALIGKSKHTASPLKGTEQKENPFAKLGLHLAAFAFLFLLVIAISSLTTIIIDSFDARATTVESAKYPLAGCPDETAVLAMAFQSSAAQPVRGNLPAKGWNSKEGSHLASFCSKQSWMLWYMFLIPLLFSLVVGRFTNPNRFSLHGLYRTRLIRPYLGASRDAVKERHPHPFTGFDPQDNIPMMDLPSKPFHVVNMAWNLVKGKRLAWQERKAVSFTASKLHCGSANYGYRPSSAYGTTKGIGPISLGSAMAISGAAASPNMGYHSSPLITFVMALFNVRLGWWLGNPMKSAWKKSNPAIAFWPLLKETFGYTTDNSNYIYLSDGGHFENLGLYEMVRRRCRYIVVGDAGCDPTRAFEDLGNAIRKIRVDLGIEIDIDLAPLKAAQAEKDGDPPMGGFHFAVGEIKYHLVDGGDAIGKIVYFKPVLCKDLPGDVYNYAREHCEFPHQTTADQWFDESQFESYRELGLHSIQSLMVPNPAHDQGDQVQVGSLKELCERAEILLRPPAPAG